MTPWVITRVRKRPASLGLPSYPVEDELHLIGSAQVEVLPDYLLEEHAPGLRAVEHLGEGELGLQDRDIVAVAGRRSAAVKGWGNRASHLRSNPSIIGAEADRRRLQPRRVGAGGEPLSSASKSILPVPTAA